MQDSVPVLRKHIKEASMADLRVSKMLKNVHKCFKFHLIFAHNIWIEKIEDLILKIKFPNYINYICSSGSCLGVGNEEQGEHEC